MANNGSDGNAGRPDRGSGWTDPGKRTYSPAPPKGKPQVTAPPPPPTPKGR